jgi:hypothetical protein
VNAQQLATKKAAAMKAWRMHRTSCPDCKESFEEFGIAYERCRLGEELQCISEHYEADVVDTEVLS